MACVFGATVRGQGWVAKWSEALHQSSMSREDVAETPCSPDLSHPVRGVRNIVLSIVNVMLLACPEYLLGFEVHFKESLAAVSSGHALALSLVNPYLKTSHGPSIVVIFSVQGGVTMTFVLGEVWHTFALNKIGINYSSIKGTLIGFHTEESPGEMMQLDEDSPQIKMCQDFLAALHEVLSRAPASGRVRLTKGDSERSIEMQLRYKKLSGRETHWMQKQEELALPDYEVAVEMQKYLRLRDHERNGPGMRHALSWEERESMRLRLEAYFAPGLSRPAMNMGRPRQSSNSPAPLVVAPPTALP
jgi:hypothetical protein